MHSIQYSCLSSWLSISNKMYIHWGGRAKTLWSGRAGWRTWAIFCSRSASIPGSMLPASGSHQTYTHRIWQPELWIFHPLSNISHIHAPSTNPPPTGRMNQAHNPRFPLLWIGLTNSTHSPLVSQILWKILHASRFHHKRPRITLDLRVGPHYP